MKPAYYDIEFRMRNVVFQQTRAWLTEGKRIGQLAAKAGVASATVSRLAYGETKHPRLHTVVAVLDALGIGIQLTGVPVQHVGMESVIPIRGEKRNV